MKFGVRKPSLKKSLSARTTGKAKRALKRSINPAYGKKGMGYINNPKKAVYNKVYSKTTVGLSNFTSGTSNGKKKKITSNIISKNNEGNSMSSGNTSSGKGCGCLVAGIVILIIFSLLASLPRWFKILAAVGFIAAGIILIVQGKKEQKEAAARQEAEKKIQEAEAAKLQNKETLVDLLKQAQTYASTEAKENLENCLSLYRGIDEVNPQVEDLMKSLLANYVDMTDDGVETLASLENRKKIEESFENKKAGSLHDFLLLLLLENGGITCECKIITFNCNNSIPCTT
ncbi:MAG: hypothetical protein CV087_09965 [Candidatus Brocadia sp. WS118]|nr:MAG: hypothetical protein CV087_09965 [Candidatus Brocadia sp. WS118]